MLKHILVLLICSVLIGCKQHAGLHGITEPMVSPAPLQQKFKNIPPLDGEKITIAVYSFTDKTGQRKPNDNFSSSTIIKLPYNMQIGSGTWNTRLGFTTFFQLENILLFFQYILF